MSREPCALIPRNILIVDSDLNLRLSLALVLKHAGYVVTTVGQASEGLERLESGSYNLVIMDIMAMENKMTLLPTVLQRYPSISTLVFTAQWSPETAAEIEQMGISAHLEKPVTPDSLLKCVESILTEKSQN